MSISKPESDVILNRANVALARSQRLVASWLPAQTDEELTNVKPEEELQREEDEIFTAVPETLGVGAPLPEKAADGSWNRTELGSNDKLRKQLLGKNYDKIMKASASSNQPLPSRTTPMVAGNNTASSAGQVPGNKEEEDDEDEEEGRTALVGKKKTNKKKRKDDTRQDSAQDADAEDAENKATPAGAVQPPSSRAASSKGKKKSTSYLDEILAERAKKRKKR